MISIREFSPLIAMVPYTHTPRVRHGEVMGDFFPRKLKTIKRIVKNGIVDEINLY